MNVRISTTPPNRPRFWKNRMKSVKSVVRARRTPVYILAEKSNVICVGEKMSPKEKAPRMLEMEDPTMFPSARGDSCWATAAIITISCKTS